MVVIYLWGQWFKVLDDIGWVLLQPMQQILSHFVRSCHKAIYVCSGLLLMVKCNVSILIQAVNAMSCTPTSILTSKITECRHTSSDTCSSVSITSWTTVHVLAHAPVCLFSPQACAWAFKNDCISASNLETFLGPSNALIQALMSRIWVLSSSVRFGID